MNDEHRKGAIITRSWLPPWASTLTAVGILATLVLWLGARPFVAALDSVSLAAVFAALVITAGTTWACAQRWSLLADRLGVGLPVRDAYRAYYRAQFLNATLPTGVVGEVDRAVWHGRSSRAMSRGIRSVVWDRATGQVVLFGLAVLAIPALPSPLRAWMLWSLAVAATALLGIRASRSTLLHAAWTEARAVPGARGVRTSIVGLSVLAAAGHVAVFIVAARSVGVAAGLPDLVPLALIVLLISAIPLGVAGWGPREGGAALVFSMAGLNAGTGLAVAVTYGVLSTCATLPGIFVLRRRRATPGPTTNPEGGPSWAIAPTRS
jgi:uncharacterized membrane protein YbhN (UPF0104 family)